MPRYNLYKLSPRLRKALFDDFCEAVCQLKDKKAVNEFFTDIFSLSEFGMLARRLLAAKMICQGKTYEEIAAKLKMGMDTVDRINRKLQSGKGYKKVIEINE